MNAPTSPTGARPPEPVQTPESPLECKWLTVDQAVTFCADRGLTRTPKTLRKWAERSYNKENADVNVRREDTIWSYRWKIERASLARKVDQELSLAGVNASEPVRMGASEKSDQDKEVETNNIEPARTGADTSEVERQVDDRSDKDKRGANMSEPVRTGSLDIRPASGSVDVLDEVRKRLEDKDAEIAFLREQLDKAQTEVERRAASTNEALKTIDRVVRSFEMQAEANKALALSGGTSGSEQYKPPRFSEDVELPKGIEQTTGSRYQQPEQGESRV